jgi:putative flavoprotein involved in K+ transport
MAQQHETIIVGGGQAGLALSYCLTQLGREHVVLEQASQAGEAWRNHRWDSFTLVTPNWQIRLPGAEYRGDDPDGFMPRADVVALFEGYVERFNLPVQYGVKVRTVEPKPGRGGYSVTTGETTLEAANVVIATGLFQKPKIPPCSANLSAEIRQLHSGQYRRPDALPPGAALVVGTGQSGCQIAEELYHSGRKVYLSVGSAGRIPRRYRGKDITWWLDKAGFYERTVDKLPSPKAKFAGNPHVSGVGGGHSLNLHQFARDGVILLGRIQDAHDGKIILAADLMESLTKADKFEADLLKMVDDAIEILDPTAPKEDAPQLRDGYDAHVILELDLEAAVITSVIWACGYSFDYSLVKLPVLDGDGFPVQQRGVTDYPGLYFLGMSWLHTFKSGLLLGVGEDAAHLASAIAARNPVQ